MTAATEQEPAYLRPEDIAATCRVTPQTVRSWIRLGVPVRGKTVKLRAVRLGVRWRVPADAWVEFYAAMNPGSTPTPTADPAAQRRAEKELDAWLGGRKG